MAISKLSDIAIAQRAAHKRDVRRPLRLDRFVPYLYLLPAFASVVFWVYRPLLQTFQLSLYEWNLMPNSPKTYVGFRNFERIFALPEFGLAVKNTLIYIGGVLPLSLLIPLFIAIYTEQLGGRSKNIYRTLIFLPMIMAPVVVAAIWRWIFHPTNGIVNHHLVSTLGFSEPIRFFTDINIAIWAITFITGWKIIGFSTLIFASGLAGINKEYFEAASIDGASSWKTIWYIKLPLLSPYILFIGMISFLFSSEWSFAYINVLTNGGPLNSTINIYYLLYMYGFQSFSVGWSAASSVIFFIAFGLIALGFVTLNKKLAFYDN